MTATPWSIEEHLPELADYVAAGLSQDGDDELVDRVRSMVVHQCQLSTSHAALAGVPPSRLGNYMSNPKRRRYAPSAPRGVKARSWVVTLDVIEGEIYVLAISHLGILRPKLQRLCRT